MADSEPIIIEPISIEPIIIEPIIIIHPRRLVFIQVANNCMFCENPQGSSYIRHVVPEAKMGYIYCGECKNKVEPMVKIWEDNYSYGPANYLKNKDIKVQRSNGEIEAGWRLCNPILEYSGNEMIVCCEKDNHIEKWCFLSKILELNPKEGD